MALSRWPPDAESGGTFCGELAYRDCPYGASLAEMPCIGIVDTRAYLLSMSKISPSSSKSSKAATIAERPAESETKDGVNLRIDAGTCQLVDEAAAIPGKTRTELIVESARRQAIDVLLGQRLFMLDAERYDAFKRTLDNPPAPGPKLRSLLRRTPAWGK
jgi:uncharacterized protein (DUF1778 family)